MAMRRRCQRSGKDGSGGGSATPTAWLERKHQEDMFMISSIYSKGNGVNSQVMAKVSEMHVF